MKSYLKILLIIVSSSLCFAGSLQPSAPPGPTMKTLDEVEPRIPIRNIPITITKSGSYYLTKDFNSPSTAITIDANDVTIDLCSFTVKGPGSGTNSGIQISEERKNIEIRNGTIRDFGANGIDGVNIDYIRIKEMKILYNKSYGIELYGVCHVIKNCIISHCGDDSPVGFRGIRAGECSEVIGNSISNNGKLASGVTCISAGDNSIISDNQVLANGIRALGNVIGINCGTANIISGNLVRDNANTATGTSVGIKVFNNNVIKGNVVTRNGNDADCPRGLTINSNNLVDQNVLYDQVQNLWIDGTDNVITSSNVRP